MAEDFIRVKTKGYNTLEDLAKEYGISMQELVSFHNERCRVSEMLSISFPRYLEYVYMPADKYVVRQDITLASTALRLPVINSDKVYGVLIKYEPKELQIHYKINVSRTPQSLVLSKERVFVNNKGVERIVEQMFEKVDKTLYPLKITINADGGINNIVNTKEIKTRWDEDTLPKLQQYYQSEVSDSLIKKFDVVFKDLDNKSDSIKRNLFYEFYLGSIYRNYSQFTYSSELKVYFASLSRMVVYQVNITLGNRYTENGKVVLKIEGIEEEDFFNQDRDKGKINIQYKLHKESHEIYSIIATMSSYDEGIEHKINFQLFEQKNN